MNAIIDMTNRKSSGTFKFQYSRHRPVNPDPRFIPKDKKLAEKIIGSFFCEFRKKYFKANIQNFRLNDQDDNKKPDALIEEDGITKGIQITQLEFTRHELRKVASKRKSKEITDSLAQFIHPIRDLIEGGLDFLKLSCHSHPIRNLLENY